VVYRAAYPEAFAHASHHLNVLLGTINTTVLIGSSLTMALAVHAAQTGQRRALILFLVLTMVLGSTFLGIKTYEYAHKFHEGLVPGPAFTYAGPDAPQAPLFFSI
jgi:cytochrome c oxidase subunit 3